MMKKIILQVLLLLVCNALKAQKPNFKIGGEYYLANAREMAAGFNLKPDSSFEFFMSYGALDRYGKGHWRVKNNTVILNSAKKPEKDFTLVKNNSVPDSTITIKITDKNKVLLQYVNVTIKGADKTTTGITNADGICIFRKQAVDSITLNFQFCPERNSAFALSAITGNYFEFKFEPWLTEVFFTNFTLTAKANSVSGMLIFIDDKVLQFEKMVP